MSYHSKTGVEILLSVFVGLQNDHINLGLKASTSK